MYNVVRRVLGVVRSSKGVLRIGLAASLVFGLILTFQIPALAASTLTVTTTADSAAPCAPTSFSLRCAIAQANTDSSGDTITFNIPATDPGCAGTPVVCTIKPIASLPAITASSTTINGFSQPGAKQNTNPLKSGLNAVITIRLDGGP